jgi:hypothetical protein
VSRGAAFTAAVVEQMAADGLVPDALERQVLRTAEQFVDRLEALEVAVARDGELLTSRTGVIRVHPAVSEHRQVSVALARVLASVSMAEAGSGGKNPVKQRAARVRWDREERRRAAGAHV